MKHGSLTLLAALGVLCSGCQNAQYNKELLERELRWQEDEIYYLQDQLSEYLMRLDAARRENASLKRELGVSDGKSYNPRSNFPAAPDTPRSRPETPGFQPPKVEPGIEIPSSDDPLKLRSSTGLGALLVPASTGIESPGGLQMPADREITQIVLNKMLTGGQNADGRGGDDGVMVVFEPRNAAGQLVPIPGEVSIVLIDPTIDGEGARVARWDFLTDEVVTRFRKTGFSRGLYFELRWPNDPPTREQMKLYVRFITPEGRKLIAEKDIRLHLTELTLAGQWTNAPPEHGERENRSPALSSPSTLARPGGPEWKPYR